MELQTTTAKIKFVADNLLPTIFITNLKQLGPTSQPQTVTPRGNFFETMLFIFFCKTGKIFRARALKERNWTCAIQCCVFVHKFFAVCWYDNTDTELSQALPGHSGRRTWTCEKFKVDLFKNLAFHQQSSILNRLQLKIAEKFAQNLPNLIYFSSLYFVRYRADVACSYSHHHCVGRSMHPIISTETQKWNLYTNSVHFVYLLKTILPYVQYHQS